MMARDVAPQESEALELKVINLTPKALTPRSRLFNIEPIGVGTAHVESLTSYIARLAEAHCVTTGALLFREFVPVLQKPYLLTDEIGASHEGLSALLASASYTINGIGGMAESWISATESLTSRSDLRFLTMVIWRKAISTYFLFRRKRAWCFLCLEDQRNAGDVIYEPLSWTLKAVKICMRHQIPLDDLCLHCNKQSLLLTYRSQPGYCYRCHQWLPANKTSESTKITRDSIDKEEFLTASIIGKMLASAPVTSPPSSKAALVKAISDYTSHIANEGKTTFSRLTKVPFFKLFRVRAHRTLPSIDTVVKISRHLKTPLADLLSGRFVADNIIQNDIQNTRSKRVAHLYLRSAAEDASCPSLAEVTQKLGYSAKTHLYKISSELCKKITARHRKAHPPRFSRKSKNSTGVIQKMLIAAMDEEPPPSISQIAERLGYKNCRPVSLRCPDLYKALVSKRKEYFRANHERIVSCLQVAQTHEPPLSVREVSKTLGYRTQQGLRWSYPEQYYAIIKRYDEFKRANKPDIGAILLAALLEEPPPTVGEIAGRAGVHMMTLYSKHSDLCRRVAARRRSFISERSIKRRGLSS